MRLEQAVTDESIATAIGQMYRSAGLAQRLLARGRPFICPFRELTDLVPTKATVLDIGCGSGLFLNLLAYHNRITSAIGIDAAAAPIRVANQALQSMHEAARVRFEHRPVEAGLPDGLVDVVSLIDVMHHIHPDHQRSAIVEAASRVSAGGLLLYKDMVSRPLWRASANRLHDLLLAQQWIHYVSTDDIKSWMLACNFTLERESSINMWWYGHEMLVFRRGDNS
jgi:2-polyprenyl-3-methyl-5-hydroxy-6-metoxy-1,4-benzoquinol methylase